MKRIFLFILTNLAVVSVLGLAAHLLGVNHYLTRAGLNLGALLGFCLVFGFGGAFISLLLSRPMAKWTTGAKVLDGSEGDTAVWLLNTVHKLADKAGIAMPQVAIYQGGPNAFATGATKNHTLVAVSTGLLETMTPDQLEAVLAHEVSHAANNDLVTLSLIQGIINTFVMFISRCLGYFIDRVLLKNDERSSGIAYTISVFVLDLLFGLVASLIVAAFSRQREYRADAGAAALLGRPDSMISALKALAFNEEGELPKNLAAFGIAGHGMWSLFSSHPPIAARIEALQKAYRRG